jgi:hypothetical protein
VEAPGNRAGERRGLEVSPDGEKCMRGEIVFVSGVGVHRDLDKAYSLFTSAGKTLDVSKQLSELSSKMNPAELAKLQ